MSQLFDALVHVASILPDKVLLSFRRPTLEVSASALCRSALEFASGLQSLGLTQGDRVAIFCEKRVEFVVALLACLRLGLIAVPINPVLKPRQVDHVLLDCAARVLITTPSRARALFDVNDHRALLPVYLDEAGDLRGHAWKALLLDRAPTEVNLLDGDPAVLLYTSGSTGQPKGVILTQRNLHAGARSVNQCLGHRADDVILSLLPLSFDAGLNQLTMALAAGIRVVLLNYLRPQEVIAACRDERPTTITGVPPLWMQLATAAWDGDGHSVRRIANTGGHMPRALLGTLRSIFPNARPYLMYGLTEAFRSTCLDPDEVDRRPDSIGKAVPNAEILVLRPDGTPCETDEPGELVHRGAFVTRGYWNDPAGTAQRFRSLPSAHGEVPLGEVAVWSGDIVRRDADGFLYFVGRHDDMIKTLGNRVSSTEVEEVLFDGPSVREAAVIGVPDDQRGQAIWAVVVLRDGPADLDPVIERCRETLPNYMVPVRFFVRDELPRNANGKIDRAGLKRELLAESAASRVPPRTARREAPALADSRSSFLTGMAYPLVLEPAVQVLRDDVRSAAQWFADHLDLVDALAEQHGAVLLRGYAVHETDHLAQWANAFPGGPLDYEMGASPRQELRGRVFESTRFPSHYRIGLHNELSYMRDYPRRIVFFCRQAAVSGGETILGDMEQAFTALPEEVRDVFEAKGVRYVRNFRHQTAADRPTRLTQMMHRCWNEIFATQDRAEAESRCRALGLGFRWLEDGGLRTEFVAPASRVHPRRAQPTWFNQATTFHPNPRSLGDLYPLVAQRYPDPEALPYTATFGDGSAIPFAMIEPVYRTLDQLTVSFPWCHGDVLILDNLRIAHGRNPYAGARDVQVFMAR